MNRNKHTVDLSQSRWLRLGRLIVAGMLLSSASAALALAQDATQQVPNNPAPPTAPTQPIPFSHKTHLNLDLGCKDCHTNPEPGKMMAYPATTKCMECHNVVATDKPAIQKLTQFANSGQPVPWVRVYQITPGVNWSHRQHLRAGMQCAMCHGDVSKLDAMTLATAVTSMASCISCHQSHNAATTCHTCHSWPAS